MGPADWPYGAYDPYGGGVSAESVYARDARLHLRATREHDRRTRAAAARDSRGARAVAPVSAPQDRAERRETKHYSEPAKQEPDARPLDDEDDDVASHSATAVETSSTATRGPSKGAAAAATAAASTDDGTVVRFVVSGQPRDVPLAWLMARWPDSQWATMADVALKSAPSPPRATSATDVSPSAAASSKAPARVVEVVVSRNLAHFDALYDFLIQGVLRVPPDVDVRARLLLEAGYYHITAAVRALLPHCAAATSPEAGGALLCGSVDLGRIAGAGVVEKLEIACAPTSSPAPEPAGPSVPAAPRAPAPKPREAPHLAIVECGDGWVRPATAPAPSVRAERPRRIDVPLGVHDPRLFGSQAPALCAARRAADDAVAIAEAEMRAELAAARDDAPQPPGLATHAFPLYGAESAMRGCKLSETAAGGPLNERPCDPRAVYPSLMHATTTVEGANSEVGSGDATKGAESGPSGSAARWVRTLSEWREQFCALTLGTLDLSGLPIVAVGEVVLAACLAWPTCDSVEQLGGATPDPASSSESKTDKEEHKHRDAIGLLRPARDEARERVEREAIARAALAAAALHGSVTASLAAAAVGAGDSDYRKMKRDAVRPVRCRVPAVSADLRAAIRSAVEDVVGLRPKSPSTKTAVAASTLQVSRANGQVHPEREQAGLAAARLMWMHEFAPATVARKMPAVRIHGMDRTLQRYGQDVSDQEDEAEEGSDHSRTGSGSDVDGDKDGDGVHASVDRALVWYPKSLQPDLRAAVRATVHRHVTQTERNAFLARTAARAAATKDSGEAGPADPASGSAAGAKDQASKAVAALHVGDGDGAAPTWVHFHSGECIDPDTEAAVSRAMGFASARLGAGARTATRAGSSDRKTRPRAGSSEGATESSDEEDVAAHEHADGVAVDPETCARKFEQASGDEQLLPKDEHYVPPSEAGGPHNCSVYLAFQRMAAPTASAEDRRALIGIQRALQLDAWRNLDVQLRLVTRDPRLAERALTELDRRLRAALPKRARALVKVVRGATDVMWLLPPPLRPVVVSLQLFHSPAHALLLEPVDCLALAWDGARVLATARSARAMRWGYNRVEASRSDKVGFDSALAEFALCGFVVALPRLGARHFARLGRKGLVVRASGLEALMSRLGVAASPARELQLVRRAQLAHADGYAFEIGAPVVRAQDPRTPSTLRSLKRHVQSTLETAMVGTAVVSASFARAMHSSGGESQGERGSRLPSEAAYSLRALGGASLVERAGLAVLNAAVVAQDWYGDSDAEAADARVAAASDARVPYCVRTQVYSATESAHS